LELTSITAACITVVAEDKSEEDLNNSCLHQLDPNTELQQGHKRCSVATLCGSEIARP